MKSALTLIISMALWASCSGPEHLVQKGNYDKAIAQYSSNIKYQAKGRRNKKYLRGLELAFNLAQSRDSFELASLELADLTQNWPRINKIYRQIQTRQENLAALGALGSKKGYAPSFTVLQGIDSLEADSRRQAAAYLYSHAQSLLAITDSTGQRQPAREAYYTLRDLKTNYFIYWENANALMDSAYREGKTHILFETSTQPGVREGRHFWRSTSLDKSYWKSEWLAFYTDSTARAAFDFRAKCRLVSLYVAPESTSKTERTETKEVEDGYHQTLDTANHVISTVVKYTVQTTTITTYSASRSANGTVLLELWDLHTGKITHTETIEGSHNASDSSELYMVSAPTEGTMISYVATGIQGSIHEYLKKVLLRK